jgi:hypothetical protein
MSACRESFNQREGLVLDSEDELYRRFTRMIQRNLHVVFTMNPASSDFEDRCTTSPALFNRCVVDWFGTWSTEALAQVAYEFTSRIDTGYTQTLYASDVQPNYTDIAIDKYNNVYVINGNNIEGFTPRNNGNYYNVGFFTPKNLSDIVNMTHIYFDEFNVLYMIINDGTTSTIQRYKGLSNAFHLIRESIDQTNVNDAALVQYSSENQKLYIFNNSNSTIYETTPSFDTVFQYFYSPANINLIGNLGNGTSIAKQLKVTQNFIVNNTSTSQNPRYQVSGDTSSVSFVTLSNRAEYMKNLEVYKDGVLLNDTDYLNQRYHNGTADITSEAALNN